MFFLLLIRGQDLRIFGVRRLAGLLGPAAAAAAAVALRGDRRKRLADPLGPAVLLLQTWLLDLLLLPLRLLLLPGAISLSLCTFTSSFMTSPPFTFTSLIISSRRTIKISPCVLLI